MLCIEGLRLINERNKYYTQHSQNVFFFFSNLYNQYTITPLQTASDKGCQHSKMCKDNLFHNHKNAITFFTLKDTFVLVYSVLSTWLERYTVQSFGVTLNTVRYSELGNLSTRIEKYWLAYNNSVQNICMKYHNKFISQHNLCFLNVPSKLPTLYGQTD